MPNALNSSVTCELRPAANGIYVNKYFTGENDELEQSSKKARRNKQKREGINWRQGNKDVRYCIICFSRSALSMKFNAFYEYTSGTDIFPHSLLLSHVKLFYLIFIANIFFPSRLWLVLFSLHFRVDETEKILWHREREREWERQAEQKRQRYH